MKQNKKMTATRKFLLAQAVFVILILGYFYISTMPSAISPIAGKAVSDPDFIFEIENSDEIVVSTSPEFTNPIILKEGSEVVLPPGTYYWKVLGFLRDSEVYTFTIESSVGLDLREGEEKTILENSGNVDLEVGEKKSGITTTAGLDVGEFKEVEGGVDYEGEQN